MFCKNHLTLNIFNPVLCIFILILLAPFIVLTGFNEGVKAQETSYQFWPEVDAYVKLSPSVRLFFELAPVWYKDNESFTESTLGAFVEAGVFPIMRKKSIRKLFDENKLRYARIRIGYERGLTREGSNFDISEQRIVTDLTARYFVPLDVLIALRNRFDIRWLDGENSWRYRARLWMERDSYIGKFNFVPYAMAEVYYDSRYKSWCRTRYQFGSAFPITSWLAPEIYYLYEITWKSKKSYLNALGLVVTLYF
jgi:hypothetical protein